MLISNIISEVDIACYMNYNGKYFIHYLEKYLEKKYKVKENVKFVGFEYPLPYIIDCWNKKQVIYYGVPRKWMDGLFVSDNYCFILEIKREATANAVEQVEDYKKIMKNNSDYYKKSHNFDLHFFNKKPIGVIVAKKIKDSCKECNKYKKNILIELGDICV